MISKKQLVDSMRTLVADIPGLIEGASEGIGLLLQRSSHTPSSCSAWRSRSA